MVCVNQTHRTNLLACFHYGVRNKSMSSTCYRFFTFSENTILAPHYLRLLFQFVLKVFFSVLHFPNLILLLFQQYKN